MAGPSNRPYDFPDPMYSIMDLEAMTNESDHEDRVRSPASSGPSSRPSSRGRGNRHQTRQQKRREQNKAAQRSFRARKEQHLSELLSKISSLELRKQNIEEENQVLMHELLRKRAENNLLRSQSASRQPEMYDRELSTLTRHISIPQETKAEGKRPVRDFPGAAEQRAQRSRNLPIESLMWLYGPFLDVWNLIKEQPAVERGDVEIDEVVERLKEMAKYEESATQRGSEVSASPSRASVASTIRRHRARSL